MSIKVDEYPLYPTLPGPDFRLTEVSRLQAQLQAEYDSREVYYKKYRRAVNIFDGIDTGFTVTGIVLGGVGTGLLASLIGAPLVPPIMGCGLLCGLLSGGAKIASRSLRNKAKKHDQIRVLAQSKINSISDIVSKALGDGSISHDEYQLISREVQGYHGLKAEIRGKKLLELDEATKRELIEQGRNEARLSLLQKLDAGNSNSN